MNNLCNCCRENNNNAGITIGEIGVCCGECAANLQTVEMRLNYFHKTGDFGILTINPRDCDFNDCRYDLKGNEQEWRENPDDYGKFPDTY